MKTETLTPRLKGGERIKITVSADDAAKVRRGRSWKATVTDVNTHDRYLLRGASCGIPECYCDAIACKID